MKWTKDLPAESGWYWFCPWMTNSPTIVKLQGAMTFWIDGTRFPLDALSGNWYGPLQCPPMEETPQ